MGTMPAAALLADAASAGAAAKQVDLDIQAYQKARNVFVNAIRVSEAPFQYACAVTVQE